MVLSFSREIRSKNRSPDSFSIVSGFTCKSNQEVGKPDRHDRENKEIRIIQRVTIKLERGVSSLMTALGITYDSITKL